MKIYFLTYGDNNFYLSKKHIISLAKRSKFFDFCISMGPKDLDYEFKNKYNEVLNYSRGGGYWIWKHRIISNLLEEINHGDVVVYCDAGASINISNPAKKRFNEYINIINSSELSNLRMECEKGYIEKYYTYTELFNYFDVKQESDIGNSLQLQAGHMFFKKNNDSKSYFKEYKKVLEFNIEIITDSLNNSNQIKNFKENRHDQSIFSLLSKIYGSEIIPNETEFRTKPTMQYEYPFLSVRSHGHGPKDYLKYFLNPKKFTKNTVFFK
tara:strand:- start:35487 stop:36290 length:804 start_codon:yes stop_codon:yes gene_type:complete